MGSGIATALLLAGKKVILKEINDKFLQGGLDRIRGNVAKKLKNDAKTASIMNTQVTFPPFECLTLVPTRENPDLGSLYDAKGV